MTAYDPARALCVLTHESASILVDLSLCILGDDDRGGWKDRAVEGKVYPPAIKAKLMCLGEVDTAVTPLEPPSAPTDPDMTAPQVALSVPSNLLGRPPDTQYVVKALIVKELDPTFDLDLWNRAARVRSQYEWSQSTSRVAGKARSFD